MADKLRGQRPTPDSDFFPLFYTLTQHGANLVFGNIRAKADEINETLGSYLRGNCTEKCFPNVTALDCMNNPWYSQLAMMVNLLAKP